ncbi:hypothetical protein C8R43DRAFT_1105369 [Mycena crocata]|nr:hypothetical protein C8R43DRAFT_1105369 [Mycena crocata]
MVCGNCTSASGSQKCGRCKMMTYCNRKCQTAHWPTHKIYCKPVQMSPQKLQLKFTIGRSGAPITFEEDIPAAFCQRDAPRDLTSRWVGNLVKTREETVLARLPGSVCVYCYKPAIKLHTTLALTLHGDPPTVFAVSQLLCTKNRYDACAVQSQETIDRAMAEPDFPEGGEIYRQ